MRRLALLLLALLVALAPSAAAKSPRSPLATDVTASAAILVDETTGDVLWGKEIHARRYVASTTKIMTVIIAMEHLRPHDVVTVDRSVRRVPPITEGLRPGEKVEAWKLFYGALLYSGNDTALALAIGVAGTRSKFVALMNEKAKSIGLNHTHFRSPSGLLDKDNYSTAADMAALARYAMANPRFRAVVRTRVKHVPWPGIGEKIYENKNHLIGAYPGANGVKTGWTTLAKHCLVASVKRNGVSLIAVILGADDMYADVKKLFAYGFATRG